MLRAWINLGKGSASADSPGAGDSSSACSRSSKVLILWLALAGLWQLGEGLYIHAKAKLAQLLIARAWSASHHNTAPVPPWPWADTYPVARLTAPAHKIDLYVLAGDSGRSLAFGPGHMTRTPLPGATGNAVISAHRDTHFRFLKDLRNGEEHTKPNEAIQTCITAACGDVTLNI